MLREYIFIKKCIELEQAARLSKEMKILPKLKKLFPKWEEFFFVPKVSTSKIALFLSIKTL